MKISRRQFITSSAAALTLPAYAASPYVGQVATRCWVPQQLDNKNLQFNSRSWHFARENLSSFQLAFANWYAVGFNFNPNGTERGVGSDARLLASIEYPQGKFTRVTWSKGAGEATIPDGETAISDPIYVAIPNGAKFYVRFFYSGMVAIPTSGGVIHGFRER